VLEDRREGRFEVVVARHWDFEQLLSDRLRGVLQVAQFLSCVMAASRGTGHDVAFDQDETRDRPRQ
jgi:hypothetical protein